MTGQADGGGVSQIRLLEAVTPIILLVALLALAVASFGDDTIGGPAQIALITCGMVAAGLGLRRGLSWCDLENAVVQSISRAAVAIMILLAVGALIGVWMTAGVIPAIVYYGSMVLSPSIFYVAALMICAIVSVAVGSSWTTAGTIGVALIGIASAMGLSVEMAAGAIISGAYFGDKLSPLSDTTNLASGLSGTDLFTHIGFLLWTTIPSFVIALLFFVVATLLMGDVPPQSQIEDLRARIAATFNVHPILFLPLAAMLMMGVRRVPALLAIFVSTLIGGLLGALYQDVNVANGGSTVRAQAELYWVAAASGYESASGDAVLDDLLSGGGMGSMMTTIWLIVSAMFFSGMMERTGMLQRILQSLLQSLRKDGSLVAGSGMTALATNAIASDQYLSIVLTSRMYAGEYRKRGLDPVNLSRVVEDSGTVTSPLVPWNTCGAFMAVTLGVSTFAYLPFCIFNLVSPVISLLYAAMGFKIRRLSAASMRRGANLAEEV